MKTCGSCRLEKPLSDFTLRGKNRPNQYQNNCDQCRAIVLKRNKQFISTLVRRWKMRKGCAHCDFKASHAVQLDLDHIVPKRKEGNDRQAINASWSKKRLKDELSKCQVLCANCHRLKTFKDGTMFQKSPTLDTCE